MPGRPLLPHPSVASSLLRKRSLAMRRLLFVPLVAALSPIAAGAESTLSGAVRTQDGLPVPQLVVAVETAGQVRRATTGPEGRYRVPGLAPGEYRVTVEAPGFLQATDARVVV